MSRLAPEFAFVATCCAWPVSEARILAARAAVNHLDWNAVLAIGRRQRVEGLLRHGLARAEIEVPSIVAAELRAAAEEVARESLLYAAETVRVQQALQAAGVCSLVLKGTAVELLAYGRLGLKRAKDIDILVDPAHAPGAIDILRRCGYAMRHPAGLTRAQFDTWLQFGRDCELVNPARGAQVELHWRLVDSPFLIPGISASSPTQQVQATPLGNLTTLRLDEHFAYLCVHGATHGWSRLKWLCDLAAFSARQGEGELARLYRSAWALGAGLCTDQALSLCVRLLGLRLPPAISDEIARNPRVAWLAAVAMDAMAGGDERELEQRPFGSSWISLSQLLLSGSLRNVPREIVHRWRRGPDLEMFVSLPVETRRLYPWLRFRRWIARRVAGFRGRPKAARHEP